MSNRLGALPRFLVLALGLISMGLAGCDRGTESSSVTFSIDFDGNEQGMQSLVSTQSAPSSLSDIDCVFIGVGGPNSGLNRNVCHTNSGNSFPLGKFSQFIPVNTSGTTEVSMDVPAGSDRLIGLIGFSISSGSCPTKLEDFHPNDGNHSSPFVLGFAAGVTLNAGTQEVPMNIAFDSTKYITDCDGPDFPEATTASNLPYLRLDSLIAYEFQQNPGAVKMTKGVCYKARLATYKCTGVGGTCSTAPYTLQNTIAVNVNSNSNLAFYISDSACKGDLTGSAGVSVIGISAATNSTDVWVAAPLNSTLASTSLASYISIDAASNAVDQVQFTQPSYAHFEFGPPKIMAFGQPTSMTALQCFTGNDVTYSVKTTNGSSTLPLFSPGAAEFAQSNSYVINLSNLEAYSPGSSCISVGSSTIALDEGLGYSKSVRLKALAGASGSLQVPAGLGYIFGSLPGIIFP